MLNQTLCSSGVELLTMMMIILVDIVLRMLMMMMIIIILVLRMLMMMMMMMMIFVLRMLTSFGSRTPLGESPLSGCRWEVLKDHLCNNDPHHNDH